MSDYISKERVKDVIDFAQGLYYSENYGLFTPWLSNQLLQNLNNNPRIPTFNKICEALSEYKQNEKNLQGYTEFMTQFDMIFKRTLYSYVNVLAFDLDLTCVNAFTEEDYQSDLYKEDKKRVYNFLDNFKYKKEFKEVLVEVLAHETDFVWYRKTKWGNKGMKFALQTMPQDYCLLTGKWEKGLLWDFDFNYFLQPGTDLDGYDPSLAKTYKRVFEDIKNSINYRPTNPLNNRTGQFAYWAQTSPENGAWAFKWNPNNFAQVPFLAPFLKNAIRNDEIEKLQYDKDIIAASAILAGEIRLFDNAKSGTKANQFAIDPVTLGSFMGKAKEGLGRQIKLGALPTENTKYYQFNDNNSSMYQDQLSTSAGVGSGVSRIIYSSDRMSNAEIEAGITDQYNTMSSMYYQFENFLDYYVNQLTKKYKFKFHFSGCSYSFDREKRFDRICKLADKGLVLNQSMWASAMGIEPQIFERSLEESKYSDWINKFSTLMLNSNTTGQNSPGRPKKDDIDLSESGQMNRDVESNI